MMRVRGRGAKNTCEGVIIIMDHRILNDERRSKSKNIEGNSTKRLKGLFLSRENINDFHFCLYVSLCSLNFLQ